MEASSPPPSLVLQCSFRSVLPAGVRPHLRDGWGMAAEGVGSAPDSPLLLFFFFFFFNNQPPASAWIPPSFHGDCGAGRGAACYSEHGLSVPNLLLFLPQGGGGQARALAFSHLGPPGSALPSPLPAKDPCFKTLNPSYWCCCL